MTTATATLPSLSVPTNGRGITKARAEEILHGKLLPNWRTTAGATITAIANRAGEMRDALVKSSAMKWAVGGDGTLCLNLGSESTKVHSNAVSQTVDLTKIPQAYLDTLLAQDPELLVHNLNKRFEKRGDTKQLIRMVGQQSRAILSPSYKRLDTFPIVSQMAEEAQSLGLVPMGGVNTDLRVSLRLCQPLMYEVMDGEWVMFGLTWGNSDFGKGAHYVSPFVFRPVCANGAVQESALREIHLGSKMTDEDILSDRTRNLQTAAAASAVRDVLHAYLDPKQIEAKLSAVRFAAAKDVTPQTVENFLKKHLTKEAVKLAKDTFSSADVEMLPPGQNVWRLSNTLSWLANQPETDPETALDYQRWAGEALTLATVNAA